MSNTGLPTIIRSIVESRALEASETITLRRWLYGDGVVHSDDIEALFRVNAALRDRHADFSRLFVQAVADFVVYQRSPTGQVTDADAAWLIDLMGGPAARLETKCELDTLVAILEDAEAVPLSLVGFALEQIKHATITGEGPAARGRVHFSRVVDEEDVALLSRILDRRSRADGTLSRAEADILFDIADACSGSQNHETWDQLFVRAIAGHLGAPEPGVVHRFVDAADVAPAFGRSRRLGEAEAEWLRGRIQRDGQVTPSESALLSLADGKAPADAAARAAIVRLA